MNYYNDNDKHACQWLRNLIKAELIPPGDVDERGIQDVQPSDLTGYTQCHFFAGIGGWAEALRIAQWPTTRPVWTGSCPCQPLSVAGLGQGAEDERHMWPEFARLICECNPPIVLGEQVASKAGREWFAGIRLDLEAMGYAVGGADLCAASVGSPNIRQRLWWVANALPTGRAARRAEPGNGQAARGGGNGRLANLHGNRCDQGRVRICEAWHDGAIRDGRLAKPEPMRCQGSERPELQSVSGGQGCGLANPQRNGRRANEQERRPEGGIVDGWADEGGRMDNTPSPRCDSEGQGPEGETRNQARVCGSEPRCADGRMEDAERRNWDRRMLHRPGQGFETDRCRASSELERPSGSNFWSSFDLIPCADGKARRVPKRSATGVVDGISIFLVTGGDINEVLRILREESCGTEGLQSAAFLFNAVLWQIKKAHSETSKHWEAACSKAFQSRGLRDVWIEAAACSASQRRKCSQQLGKQCDDCLPAMPHGYSRCEWDVGQWPGGEIGVLRLWEIFCGEEPKAGQRGGLLCEMPFRMGTPLCDEKMGGRVALLRGYGNAINPYVAAEFISAFMEIERIFQK